jgi:signal transduction histidine kinase
VKRRVRSLGGELVVESRPGQGASLKIRIPV